MYLKCRRLQFESCCLVNAEHDVHVLDGLANSTFQQVVNGRGDQHFVAVFLHMYQGLVGIHHLFQIYWFVTIVGESGILVEVLISLNNILYGSRRFDDGCAENTTGKVTTIGDEVDVGIQIALYLLQTLTNLGNMLILRKALR